MLNIDCKTPLPQVCVHTWMCAHVDMCRGSLKCCLLTSCYHKGLCSIQPPVQCGQVTHTCASVWAPQGHLQPQHTKTCAPCESRRAGACQVLATADLPHPQQPKIMSPPYTCAQAPQPSVPRGRGCLVPEGDVTIRLWGDQQEISVLGKIMLSSFGTMSSSSLLHF